ncbi:hypothetical protein ACWCPM_29105 [Streptomyces sp. NPDC002309]
MPHFKQNTSTAFAGDVIFYDWKGDGKAGQASIITKISNGKIHVSPHHKNYEYRSLAAHRSAGPEMKIWICRPKPERY